MGSRTERGEAASAAAGKARVAVSACLLGHEVRWDGGHKRHDAVAIELARHFDLVPVCPEVAIGLGVPREPIHLVTSGVAQGAVRLVGVRDRADHTSAMERFAREEMARLVQDGLDGWVFKVRSPSCGPSGVPVWGAAAHGTREGAGVFVRFVAALLPGLPVTDEEALASEDLASGFIEAVRAHWRRRIASR